MINMVSDVNALDTWLSLVYKILSIPHYRHRRRNPPVVLVACRAGSVVGWVSVVAVGVRRAVFLCRNCNYLGFGVGIGKVGFCIDLLGNIFH